MKSEVAEVRVLAGQQIFNYGTVSLTFAESFNSFFQQCTFNREFLAAFPITTSFASSIVSTKIFIRCCFTLSAGIAWKNLFVIWKKGAKLRGNVWNKTKASGSQHTRFNSIYLNLTGVSKNGRTCPKSDKSPKIEWNRPKSNGTVRKQAKMSDTRRNLPIPDGSFWNGMWNEMWKVFETRRETLKIGRNYSKLHGSVRNRLFLSCLEGKKKITVPAIKASDGLDATKHFLHTASKQVAKTHFMALTWPIIVNIGAGCPGQTADLR